MVTRIYPFDSGLEISSAFNLLDAAWKLAVRKYIQIYYHDICWYDDFACYCRCPGEDLHTNRTASNHCRIYLDAEPVPTIHCQHQSCGDVIAAHNQVLRRLWKQSMSGTDLGLDAEQMRLITLELAVHEQEAARIQAIRAHERAIAAGLKQWAQAHRTAILKECVWTADQIRAASPSLLPEAAAKHWRLVLSVYAPEDRLWIADEVFHSGEWKDGRNFDDRFRTVEEWVEGHTAPGVYICPAVLKAGATRRSNPNVLRRPFIVAESDVLNRDQVGAVFQWMMAEGLRLRFVIDTGSKSLHGWFAAPDDERIKWFKAILPEFGIDPKVLTASQPVRLPGARNPKTGNLQQLIYADLLP